MKGLDLSEEFYWEIVRPLIARRFPQLMEKHAAGLIGYGSDVLGHDDDLSRDHEWGARCYIWLQDSDYDQYAVTLDQALDEEVPALFQGYPARFSVDESHKVLIPSNGSGNLHHIAITCVSRHMRIQLGLHSVQPSLHEWLMLPEQKLLEWTRGRIFTDPIGKITEVRKTLAYLPDDIWRYKLKYAWSSFCHLYVVKLAELRGETLSARLLLNRMVEQAVQLVFLYNRRYRPGTYKWLSRKLAQISPVINEHIKQLEAMLMEPSIARAVEQLEGLLRKLAYQHNGLKITEFIELQPAPFYARGRPVYSAKSDITRTGIGDMIV
ncbi:DUF4037 domain-containing protein [Paenibacillus sp. FSL P2-0136]|uniref:DUF4037 domain-containing protein n=1 Tax=Paenibacillus sp. FSL P2-0136 TaxID=2975317 RepID=UPI0030D9267A